MKAYRQVVAERYDGREQGIHPYHNRYAPINPIGFCVRERLQRIFYDVFQFLRRGGLDLTQARIIDVGCGEGAWTRFFAELAGHPQNILGIDLSKVRIARARAMNPALKYDVFDLVRLAERADLEGTFDLATAILVFEHLESEETIRKAIRGIRGSLKEHGFCLFYDLYARDHFHSPANAESWGFSPSQIEGLFSTEGFRRRFFRKVFRNVLFRYHSAYLCERFPSGWVRAVETLLPGTPGNLLYLFQKADR